MQRHRHYPELGAICLHIKGESCFSLLTVCFIYLFLFFVNFRLIAFHCFFLERVGGVRERERDVREKHELIASRMHPNGDEN